VRISLLVILAWILVPALALANPKVAVAPLDGDDDGKVAKLVDEAAASVAKVTSAKAVAKALDDLSITDPDNSKAAKRLRAKLGVDAVIYGKLERDGAKKKLSLSIYTRGKKPEKFAIEYKVSSSKAFRDALKDQLGNKLAPDDNGKDDDDDDGPKPAAKPEPKPERSESRSTHESTSSRHTASTDDDDDDSSGSVHKRGHRHKSSLERDRVTQGAVFADAGAAGVHRGLTYVPKTGGTAPPPVGTAAAAGQFDGEIYPGAFDTLQGTAAALGLYASANKALGLKITIPGSTQSSAINQMSYAVGARYRFIFGQSSLAIGASYWGQSFVADRSTLTTAVLNMPDTSYTAFAPGALLRAAASPTIGVTVQVDVPLMLKSGPITDPTHFGAASVVSFAVTGGLDIALGPNYGLHFSAAVNQEKFSFKGGMITSATDRTIAGGAMFALMY
jgi:hypothetical protein